MRTPYRDISLPPTKLCILIIRANSCCRMEYPSTWLSKTKPTKGTHKRLGSKWSNHKILFLSSKLPQPSITSKLQVTSQIWWPMAVTFNVEISNCFKLESIDFSFSLYGFDIDEHLCNFVLLVFGLKKKKVISY